MLISLYNIFKAFVLFIKFLNFIYYYKIFFSINNNKLYYLILLNNYSIKLNNILLLLWKFKSKRIKIFYLSKILKWNFLYNLKKYSFNIEINNFFDKFYMLKLFNKTKQYFNSQIHNKIIYKQFHLIKIFKDINNDTLINFFNVYKKNKNKSLYNKFSFIFFINKVVKKNIKKFSKLKKFKMKFKLGKLKKKLLFKNLFSLFFFNLFIYFFLVYLFIFWLNNLLNKIFYINDLFLLKMLKYNRNLSFYKANFNYSYSYNKKKEYNTNYYLKILKLNKYYLMYNKLNLLKFYNMF